MKNKILLASALCITIAMISSVGASLFATDKDFAVRVFAASWTLVTSSIGFFFVGLVYPKENSK